MAVEKGFFGQVAIPDQHVLAEPDVSPKDREAKKEFAEILIVIHSDHALKHSESLQNHARQGHHSHDDHEGARKEIDTKDGGEPMRVKRHQDIHASKRRADSTQYKANGAVLAKLLRDRSIRIYILAQA